MVINIGKLMDGDYAEVERDVAAVVQAAKQGRQKPAVVKVCPSPVLSLIFSLMMAIP